MEGDKIQIEARHRQKMEKLRTKTPSPVKRRRQKAKKPTRGVRSFDRKSLQRLQFLDLDLIKRIGKPEEMCKSATSLSMGEKVVY